jgi:phosphonate transport system substrate-binding protein
MQRRNFIYYSLLFAAGCTAASSNKYNIISSKSSVSLPKNLRFTSTDEKNIEELQSNFGAFKTAIEQVLETKIEMVLVQNYIAAVTALQLGQLDLVLLGPSEYVISRARTQAVPLTAITRPNYYSLFAVYTKSGIKSLAQLKGKKIALGNLGAAGSYIGPMKILIDAGLNPKTDVEIVLIKEEQKRILALKKGEIYASAFSNNTYDREVIQKKADSEFLVIAKSPPLPNDVFVLSSKFEPAVVELVRSRILQNQDKLIQALLVGRKHKKYNQSQFIPANDADYNMIREVYQAIGQGQFL